MHAFVDVHKGTTSARTTLICAHILTFPLKVLLMQALVNFVYHDVIKQIDVANAVLEKLFSGNRQIKLKLFVAVPIECARVTDQHNFDLQDFHIYQLKEPLNVYRGKRGGG